MSGVKIRVSADTRPAELSLNKLDRSLNRLEQQGQKLGKTFRNVGIAITAAFGATVALKSITNATDSITNLNNKIATVTKSTREQTLVFKELVAVSKRTRTSVDGNVTAFQRFSLSLESLGKSTPQIIKFTETFAKAGAVGGATAQEISNSAIQLGQGLAAGALRGEELNSVLENNVVVARLIAEEFGVGVGMLKSLAADGELTSDRIFKALEDGADGVQEQFKKMVATTEQLATVMGDSFRLAISELDKVIGVSALVKKTIRGLTAVFDYIGNNAAIWALKTKISFKIVEVSAKILVIKVREFFKNLFSGNIDTDKIIKDAKAAFDKIYTNVKEVASKPLAFAIDISVEAYDFAAAVLPNTKEIYDALWSFVQGVEKIFAWLHGRIVGNSLWTGTFDPAHEEGGAAAVGNTSALLSAINPVLATLTSWTGRIIEIFKRLWKKVTAQWDSLNQYFADNELTTPDDAIVKLEETFISSVNRMKSKYEELLTKLKDTEAYQETSAAAKELDNKFGITEKVSGLSTSVTEYVVSFDKEAFLESVRSTLASAGPLFDNFRQAFFETPLVVGIIEVGKNVLPDVEELFIQINKAIEENSKIGAAIISVGLTAVFNKAFRGALLKGAIWSGIAYAFATAGNSENFQKAVEDVAYGFGAGIKKLLSGEGDGNIVADIVTGVKDTFKAAARGLLTGLFDEVTEDGIVENMTAVLIGAATAFTVSPLLRKGMLGIGSLVLGSIFSKDSQDKKIKKAVEKALAKQTGNVKVNSTAKANTASIGRRLGGGIARGVSTAMGVYFASSAFTSAINLDGKLGIDGIGDTVSTALTGAALGAQVGAAFGPAGMIGGAIIGGVGGAMYSLWNDPEQRAAISGFFVDGWASITDSIGEIKDDLVKTFKDSFLEAWGLVSESFSFKLGSVDNVNPAQRGPQNISGAGDSQGAGTGRDTGQSGAGENKHPRARRAFGGYVSGPGTGVSDSIPALLSNGEYVIKASAVQSLGKGRLDKINQGILPKFANGGLVSNAAESTASAAFGVGLTSDAFELIALNSQLRELSEANAVLSDAMGENTQALTEDEKKKGKGKGSKTPKDTRTELEKAGDSYFERFTGAFASGLSEAIKTGDYESFIDGVLDTFTSTVIDSFVDGLTEGLFKDGGPLDMSKLFENLFSGGEGAGGKGGGIFGSLLSGIGGSGAGASGGGWMAALGGLFQSFSQGGTVPNTPYSQAGKDSVPAMLMPGEQVLSKNDVRNMNNNGSNGGSTQSFNINVQGDVSRQTRQEIVKMMPQISNGVNGMNKENNYRR